MPQKKPKVSDQELEAFLDDELEPARRQEIISMLKEDPTLLKRLAANAQLNNNLSRLYEFVLDEPIPQDLIEIVESYMPDKET